jgi:hypothetical protein
VAELDAAALVGLLADSDRRRVVAALVLGAADLDAIERAAGLTAAQVGRALARLVSAGLVVRGADGTLAIVGAAFGVAARSAAAANPTTRHDGPPEVARVLDAFVRDGRLVSIPVAHAKRLVVLDRLAQEFEPGRQYSEPMVNLILGRWHADTAALRRYLVDDGFLERRAGRYWRAGGTFEVDPA